MIRLTASRVLEIVDRAVETWVKEQGTEQDIIGKVRRELDASVDAIARYAIGIRRDGYSADRFEVETRSPGYVILRKRIEAAASDWLGDNVKLIEPKLTNQAIADLKKHFSREYERDLQKVLSQLAEKKAKDDAALIVGSTMLSTDAMREALNELIVSEDEAEAAEAAARGRQFLQRTKLKSAEVKGVVAYDGHKLSPLIQDPDASCWHVVQLESVFGFSDCYVLTNGKEWHPLDPSFSKDELLHESSSVLQSFRSSRQMIFNFLDEADRLFITQAIAEHYKNDGGSGGDDGGEIPF